MDAKVIKDIRLCLMMSQKEFAEMLNISVTTENRWEKGHHLPSYKTQREIRRIYRALQTAPKEFFIKGTKTLF